MNRLTCVLAVALGLSFAGCRKPAGGTPTDAGGPGGGDAGSLTPQSGEQIAGFVESAGIAAALGGPFAPAPGMPRADAVATDAQAHMTAEGSFSEMSVVTPPTCASFMWSGLTASVTMTGCTLEATGQPVSGTISLAVTRTPTSFTVGFASLMAGGLPATYDGHVTLNNGGTDRMPAYTIDIDFMATTSTQTSHFTATGLGVTRGAASIGIDGTIAFSNGSVTASGALTALTWQTGQCLPSSGTAVVTGVAPLPVTITFLPTTPMDGKVQLQLGTFPPVDPNPMLFAPCGSGT